MARDARVESGDTPAVGDIVSLCACVAGGRRAHRSCAERVSFFEEAPAERSLEDLEAEAFEQLKENFINSYDLFFTDAAYTTKTNLERYTSMEEFGTRLKAELTKLLEDFRTQIILEDMFVDTNIQLVD